VVIGGHYGIKNGVSFVFYKLDELQVGEKIYIEDDHGDTLAFVVRSISLYDRNDDATAVFTSNDGLAHLNLITCEGVWNKVNGNYPERRVVFADAIPAEGAAPAASAPALRLGARGAEVAALQTALVLKDFLTMPRGVVKGYFGALTRTAVLKYQKSVGLSPDGILGSLTRAKLWPATVAAVQPALPATAIAPPPTAVSSFQLLIQYAKSLFATQRDGLITSGLLMLLILTAYQIIRRRKGAS
jgi:LPXTG-site transpeptidase (sortase) family protein